MPPFIVLCKTPDKTTAAASRQKRQRRVHRPGAYWPARRWTTDALLQKMIHFPAFSNENGDRRCCRQNRGNPSLTNRVEGLYPTPPPQDSNQESSASGICRETFDSSETSKLVPPTPCAPAHGDMT